MSDFDPYLKWLGIRSPERPPNHYRLLGLDQFENDPDIIAAAADQRMGHIRSFQSGPEAELSQKLLNELALARRCLMSKDRKKEYDAELLAQMESVKKKKPKSKSSNSKDASEQEESQSAEPAIKVTTAKSSKPSSKKNKSLVPVIAIVAAILLAVIVGVIAWLAMRGNGEKVADKSPSTQQKQPASKDQQPTEQDKDSKNKSNGVDNENGSTKSKTDKPDLLKNAIADGKAPWDIDPVYPEGPPSVLTANESELEKRLHPVYFALSIRDSDIAKKLLDSLLKDPNLKGDSDLESTDQIVNCRKVMGDQERFWVMYDIALTALKQNQPFLFRQRVVKVKSLDQPKVELEAQNGSVQSFDLGKSQVPRDLAVAIFELKFHSESEKKFRDAFLEIDFQEKRELLGAEFDLQQVLSEYEKLANADSKTQSNDGKTTDSKTDDTKKDDSKTALKDPKKPEDGDSTNDMPELNANKIEKVAAPDGIKRASGLRQLKKTYSEYYEAKDPLKMIELMDVLIADAQADDIEDVSRYVMFDEARKISVLAGMPKKTVECVDWLGKYFELDLFDLAKKSLDDVGRKINTGDGQEELIEGWTKYWQKALNEENFVRALEFIDRTNRAARKLGDSTFLKRMSAIKSDVQDMKSLATKARKSEEVLSKDADNEAANLATGKYLCFVKNDFEKGIPYLAKGSDSKLKLASETETKLLKVAEEDQTAEQQLEVARAWMVVARKGDLASKRLKLHAGKWFEKAEIQLKGLKKKEIGKILDEIDLIKTEFDAGSASAFGPYRFLAEHTWEFDWKGFQRWENGKFTSDGKLSFVHDGNPRTANWTINRLGNIEIRAKGKFSFILIPKSPTKLAGQRLTIRDRKKRVFEVVDTGTIRAVGSDE